MLRIGLYVLILFLCIAVSGTERAPKITISNGRLSGQYLRTRKGRAFSAFQSIPYARPPVGEFRFEVGS